MPRPPRLDLPGLPLHVVQRAVDRRPCFVLEIHYREYLRHLLEQAATFGCEVHAYVLMSNHVHILVTPAEAGGVGRLMKSVGRRFVGFFNLMMERKGTLWEGRFKSCLVGTDDYLLRCYRYIELNPVRAGVTTRPELYPWSSNRCNALGFTDPLVTPHQSYLALGPSQSDRIAAYSAIVAQGCEGREADEIRAMTSRQRAFGTRQFKEFLEAEYNRPMGIVRRGRPPLLPEVKPGV